MIDSFTGHFRFLSNFHPCKVMFEGLTFNSVEHAYQAAKTKDLPSRILFTQDSMTAGQAKRAGQKLTLREDWDSSKVRIMRSLVGQKFQNNPLRDMLKATDGEELIEGNTWGDVFWGVCKGKGENWLGKILMEVRADLLRQDMK